MNSGHERGSHGEERALLYLRELGWRILKKNFRTRRGEVDIIGDDGTDVVFVEIKTWAAYDRESLEYAVDGRKQVRIVRTAKRYLAAHPQYSHRTIRFDVIFISSGTETIEHLRSAFEASWDG